jgi:hypothetical protein
MVLSFDRIVLPQGDIVPIQGKVVDVPQCIVDKQGRIQGRGHAKRDIVLWAIPILWPIDLLNLPRRGPKPTLRAETNITVKLMDDLQLPAINAYQQQTAYQQALPSAPMPTAEYQPTVLRTRPPAPNPQYQQQAYPAYPYPRAPYSSQVYRLPPANYSYPRGGEPLGFDVRTAKYYPGTFDRQ